MSTVLAYHVFLHFLTLSSWTVGRRRPQGRHGRGRGLGIIRRQNNVQRPHRVRADGRAARQPNRPRGRIANRTIAVVAEEMQITRDQCRYKATYSTRKPMNLLIILAMTGYLTIQEEEESL